MKRKIQLLCAFLLVSILTYGQTQIGSDIVGEAAMDNSGYSVSLSSDGNIVAIGAYGNTRTNPVLTGQGHVRVYENVNGLWTQLGGDIDGETVGDASGSSVSLSSDGNIVAIGAPLNDGNYSQFSGGGHVRIYEYDSGSWILIGEIDGQPGDGSGVSVSLSSNGNIVVIGASLNNDYGENTGVVRIYEYDNVAEAWFQLGGNIYGESAMDNSGYSVSLSSDGSIVAIGANGNDDNGNNAGHVRVYEYDTIIGGWIQLGTDIDGESENDNSGSVSLSSDGTILAVGSALNDDNGNNSGHVRVYEYSSGTWSQLGSNIVGEAAGDQSGGSISLSLDGSIIAIGAYVNNLSGHTRVFEYDSGTWTQRGDDIDGELPYDRFGRSVSLSADGSIVAIGADGNDANGDFSGHVRIFDMSNFLSISNPEINSSIGIYPTVVSNTFTVTAEGNVFNNLTIYNSLGKKIIESTDKQVDVSGFTRGLYYVSVNTIQGIIVKKIIKK